VGETSNLVVLSGSDAQFIDTFECKKALRVGSRVGVRLPARLTSGGKVLLADLPFEEVALLHPQLADDPAAISAMKRMLSAIRRQGFGTNFQESERGVVAVGMAVRGTSGAAIAAVSISAPTVRLNRGQIINMIPGLTEAVEGIRSDIIGHVASSR
jgi:IclR family acetate operon transcriptional repressor